MLAIVIPYFKLQFFEETLQSLADQTNKDFTVYIGDDASLQDCRPLLKQFEGKFSFVYKRFETNLGSTSLTQQWHRCIDLIADDTIQWVMLLGDDDILGLNVVEDFFKYYSHFNQKSSVIRFATILLNQIENYESPIYANPVFENGFDFLNRKLNGETRSSLSEFIFNFEKLRQIGFTDYASAFYSDDRIILDLSIDNTIYSINDSVIIIRVFEESLSGKASLNFHNLSLARFDFYTFIINTYYKYLNTTSRKKIIDFLIGYGLTYKILKIRDFVKFYSLSFFLLDFNFFIKINKKILRLKLNIKREKSMFKI